MSKDGRLLSCGTGPLTIRDGLCAIWQEDPDLAWDVYNDQAALLGYGPHETYLMPCGMCRIDEM